MSQPLNRPPRTLLGFDYGLRRIGVAVGQEVTHSVAPLITLSRKTDKPDWDAITRLIDEWQPDLLVVGLPLTLEGEEQEMTQRARRFGNQLKGRYNLPVEMVDERLTSYEAEQLLAERSHNGAGRNDPEDIDQVAAQLILQSWFDQQLTPEQHERTP
ncbi:MAG: Holliday junction resolvase RuvX [Thiohalophilus sp.]|uniref:Holliday junction resolvase RuvX n=1 Tax=Thiohalophilus sp. TaxID=3028392 RepID=UPI002870B1D2|nr:Holliday junction resolvase RuvX [Thiohalophilus sp.]MDR9436552.1 Holliday junction resolvase RuvX [Thiohalophilus sp.]